MKQVHNSHFIYFRYTLISFFRLRLDIPRRHLTLGLPVRNIIFFPSKMCHMLHKPHYAWICQINNEAPQYTVVTSLLSILLQTQILTIFLQHPVLEHPPLMLTPPPKKKITGIRSTVIFKLPPRGPLLCERSQTLQVPRKHTRTYAVWLMYLQWTWKYIHTLSNNYSNHLTNEATYQTIRVTYSCLRGNGHEVLAGDLPYYHEVDILSFGKSLL